jgi:hypothetical protein
MTARIPLRRESYASRRRLVHRMVAVSSILFLPSAILRRLFGLGAARAGGERLSVFAEARASAAAIVPFIFMG